VVPNRGALKAGGGGSAGLQTTTNTPNRNLKKTDFVDIVISKVLCDLPFSRNEPLKSTDWYIRILKNKLIKLEKKTRRQDTVIESRNT
jgi:hypothetical protein